MTFKEWVETVPTEMKGDPLWPMEAYRLSLFLGDLAWRDVSKLVQDRRMLSVADQLNRAVGSISANIAEGYSRQSGKDQARFYEYALGSARESRNWYYQARHVLSEQVADHRIKLATQIIRLLLSMVPSERGYKISEEPIEYNLTQAELLDNPPLSEFDEQCPMNAITHHAPRTTDS